METAVTNAAIPELNANGISFVSYAHAYCKTAGQGSATILPSNEFTPIESDDAYVRSVFNSDSRMEHQMYKYKEETIAPPAKLPTGVIIKPKFHHYITVYRRNLILFQSVLVCCRNEIIKNDDFTQLASSISTDDILYIINNVIMRNDDLFAKARSVFGAFAKCMKLNVGPPKMHRFQGVQIWDIDDGFAGSPESVTGKSLSDYYEYSLAAIRYHDLEHTNHDGLWKSFSDDQVKNAFEHHEDIHESHQVMFSEAVCIEISQINIPKTTEISIKRLYNYGYDSTSIWLWGYITVLDVLYRSYYDEANNLASKAFESEISEDVIISIEKEKARIKGKMNQTEYLMGICDQDRHKRFINSASSKACGKKSLTEDMLDGITDSMSRVLSALSAKTQKRNARTSIYLSILGLILGLTFVIQITRFVVDLNPSWNNAQATLVVCISAMVLLAIVFCLIWKLLTKRMK